MNSIIMLVFLLVIVFLLLIFPIKKRRINFDEKGEAIKIYQEEVAHINRQFDEEFIDEKEKAQLLAELDKKSALAITAIEKKTFAYKSSFVPLALIVLGLSVASFIYYRHYQQSGVMRWQAFKKNFHGQITEGLFDEKVVANFVGKTDIGTTSTYCFAMQSELLEKYDTNPDALANLASCFLSASYPQLAEQAILRGLKSDKHHLDLNYLAAELQYSKDRILSVDSVNRLMTIIKSQPDHFKSIRLLAISSLSQGNYPQAKFFFTKLKGLAPDDNQELSSALDRLLFEIDGKIKTSGQSESMLASSLPANHPTVSKATNPHVVSKNIEEKAEQKADSPESIDDDEFNKAAVRLQVKMSPKLAKTAMGDKTLFVVIKSVDGQLINATKRLFNGDKQPLLLAVTDGDEGMMKMQNMTGYSTIQVVARISQNGSPIAQSGDLTSESITISLPQQSQVKELLIDRKIP